MAKKACATQCPQCPFRRTSLPGYLGSYEGPGAVHSSLWHKEPFFCHTRTNYRRRDWRQVVEREGKLCLGALIFVGRAAYFPKPDDPEIAVALVEAMEGFRANSDSVDVMEGKEFIDYHTMGSERNAQAFRDLRDSGKAAGFGRNGRSA
jgi:hypothetical protein